MLLNILLCSDSLLSDGELGFSSETVWYLIFIIFVQQDSVLYCMFNISRITF